MLLLAAASAALAASALLALRARPRARWDGPPSSTDPAETVTVLVGARALDGGELSVRLAPWHADRAQQGFDAHALRRELDLPEGSAWRLELAWSAREGASSGGRALDYSAVEVVDAAGAALAPIARGAGDARARALDPVRTLAALPREPLRAGARVDLMLWGRGAASPARVRGLSATGAGTAVEAIEVELRAAPAPRSELLVPMARVDRGPRERNTAPSRASGDAHGDDGEQR